MTLDEGVRYFALLLRVESTAAVMKIDGSVRSEPLRITVSDGVNTRLGSERVEGTRDTFIAQLQQTVPTLTITKMMRNLHEGAVTSIHGVTFYEIFRRGA